ncbi:hypothetical protein FDECE_3514 [Fusarium decemcellulare]|nr:hypothetical protein FDECE_3514 [Fusarium decemcellulare]
MSSSSLPVSKEGRYWDFEKQAVINGLPSPAVKEDTKNYAKSYDAIVVGAGFTGLIAARDLSVRGHRVLLLEGRDRIGGRTWVGRGKHNDYEMGGGWVHHLQPNIWAEMSRYGLTEQKKSIALGPETPVKMSGALGDLGSAFRLAETFFNVDDERGSLVIPQPHKPLANRDAVDKWDISVQQRLDQMDLPDSDKKLLELVMATFGLTGGEKTGFLSLLRLYALSDYDFARLMELNSTLKIPGGTTALANAMFDEFKGTALFNRKVTAINSNIGPGAQVIIDGGETFEAKHVICTIPINCLSDVQFSPALAPCYSSVRHHNLGGKLHVHSDNGSLRFFGVSTPDRPSIFGFSESTSEANGTNMVIFKSSDSEPQAIEEDPLKLLNDSLSDLVPQKVETGQINDFLWHDWRIDEFAKGTWSIYGPKVLTGDLARLMENRQVSDSVLLAGSDIADGWVGYMDGAVEQGRRASYLIGNRLISGTERSKI